MGVDFVAVTFDVRDPSGLAEFWGGLLGREVADAPGGPLLPADGAQVGLQFVAGPTGLNRMHLHVTSAGPGDQRRTVETALALGARHLDVGQLPDEEHVVLADPGGNEFCVIEAGNAFLAGCGLLGEVSCDGTRAVGRFWSEALGWPLVWDQAEETAVQSPLGGTKLSWGGPPVAPKPARNGQRFSLATDDLDAEIARLLSLGATRLADHQGGVELADPDGNEFSVVPVSR